MSKSANIKFKCNSYENSSRFNRKSHKHGGHAQTHQDHGDARKQSGSLTSEAPCRLFAHSIFNHSDGIVSITSLIDSNLNLFVVIKLILHVDEIIGNIALSLHLKWLECVGISTTESKHLGFHLFRSKPHILRFRDLLPLLYNLHIRLITFVITISARYKGACCLDKADGIHQRHNLLKNHYYILNISIIKIY